MYKSVSCGESLFWTESTVGAAYTVSVIGDPMVLMVPVLPVHLLVLPPSTRTLSSYQGEHPGLLPNPGLGQQ